MSLATIKHDPSANLPYGIDWSTWLLNESDSIATSTWTDPSGELTLTNSQHTGGMATTWVTGGQAGINYTLTNRITTTGGRTDERSITLRCVER